MLANPAKRRKHDETGGSDDAGMVTSSKVHRVTAVEHVTAAMQRSQTRRLEAQSEEQRRKRIAGCKQAIDKNNRRIWDQEQWKVELQQEAEAATSEWASH